MPYEDPDPADPLTLHGVSIETDDAGAIREMAGCFVEEFLRMGFDRGRLMSLFRNPGYAGPFMAFRELGQAEIARMIDERMGLRGRESSPGAGPCTADNEIRLPILETGA